MRKFYISFCFLCTRAMGPFLLLVLMYPYSSGTAIPHRQHTLSHTSTHPLSHYRYAGRPAGRNFACQRSESATRCYGPEQIRRAYAIQPLLDEGIAGQGQTIVIVNAYDAPHLREDLYSFDQAFGLNDPELEVFYPDGHIPFDRNNEEQVGWSGEIMLDVEWAHVVAPDARIALVLARSSADADVISALRFAVDHELGDVISMSFGEGEGCVETGQGPAWHRVFADATRKNMTLLAATGDTGAAEMTCDGNSFEKAISVPASDPLVTAVGGTQLFADYESGAYKGEVVWNEPDAQAGGNGGFSKQISKPFYQGDISAIGAQRGVPDVAYNAAFNGGFLVSWSDGPQGDGTSAFYVYSGTSAGTPQWAGISALTNQLAGQRLGCINPALYFIGRTSLYGQGFHDITVGNNSVSLVDKRNQTIRVDGYSAAPGWDATTGLGTPIVASLAHLLAGVANAHLNEDRRMVGALL